MCHLFLILPVLGLGVFWILPLPLAIGAYALLVVLSVWVYVTLMRTLHAPARCGLEAVVGATGVVVEAGPGGTRVRAAGDVWRARPAPGLAAGDRVRVVGVRELTLVVRAEDPAGRPAADRLAPRAPAH